VRGTRDSHCDLGEVCNWGGTLGGRLALAGAASSSAARVAANVCPAQSSYAAPESHLAGDGEEKVYGSIP
jgi:hypothetical protein